MMAGVNRRPLLALACLAAALGASLGACSAADPVLHPWDSPPNIVIGQVLLQVPDDLVAALADPETVRQREAALAAVAERRRVLSTPGLETAIRAHQVATGMTVDEVVWSVGSHPTGVRDQGPPGGHTLLWEAPGLKANRRFWVRLDEWGKVAAAGSH
jgi:hypothetical protein